MAERGGFDKTTWKQLPEDGKHTKTEASRQYMLAEDGKHTKTEASRQYMLAEDGKHTKTEASRQYMLAEDGKHTKTEASRQCLLDRLSEGLGEGWLYLCMHLRCQSES